METQEITVEEATKMVEEAITEHGIPVWVSHVSTRIRKMVPADIKSELIRNATKSVGWGSAQDGRNTIIAWCRNNVFEIVTAKQLADIGGISEATVRSLAKDRADIFRKSEGRTYEIRDPQADRQLDRQQ